MIENRPWLRIFSHTMLILGIAVILFPLYVAFVAATLDKQAVYAAPMTLIPGTHLLENIHNIWVNGHYARQNYRLDALGICHCLVSFSAT